MILAIALELSNCVSCCYLSFPSNFLLVWFFADWVVYLLNCLVLFFLFLFAFYPYLLFFVLPGPFFSHSVCSSLWGRYCSMWIFLAIIPILFGCCLSLVICSVCDYSFLVSMYFKKGSFCDKHRSGPSILFWQVNKVFICCKQSVSVIWSGIFILVLFLVSFSLRIRP